MPLLGTREVAPLLEGTAVMDGYGTEPLELKGAGILNLVFEIRQDAMISLLPPSLHPTIPPTIVITVTTMRMRMMMSSQEIPKNGSPKFTCPPRRGRCPGTRG